MQILHRPPVPGPRSCFGRTATAFSSHGPFHTALLHAGRKTTGSWDGRQVHGRAGEQGEVSCRGRSLGIFRQDPSGRLRSDCGQCTVLLMLPAASCTKPTVQRGWKCGSPVPMMTAGCHSIVSPRNIVETRSQQVPQPPWRVSRSQKHKPCRGLLPGGPWGRGVHRDRA